MMSPAYVFHLCDQGRHDSHSDEWQNNGWIKKHGRWLTTKPGFVVSALRIERPPFVQNLDTFTATTVNQQSQL